MKKTLLLIITITVLQSFTSFAQTRVYDLFLPDLINTSNLCGGSSTIRYQHSWGGDWGFSWTSTGTRTPTSITVEMDYAINCSNTPTNKAVRLNGVNQVSQPTPGPYYCDCYPPLGAAPTTWTLNPDDYNVGGVNTVLISSFQYEEGINILPAYANAYVRVTVNYSAIGIKGLATSIPSGDVTPKVGDDTEYGSVAESAIVDHTFTIENKGGNDLALTGTPRVTISGSAAFSIQTQPTSGTIAGGGSETFAVRFAPTCATQSVQNAIVTIANDDPDVNPYTFTVQGTGTDNVTPTAVAKNIIVQLDATGSVTVNAADLDNESTDNCSIASYMLKTGGTTGTVCATAGESNNLMIAAPADSEFTAVNFASYGTPGGSCGNFTQGSCHSGNSMSVVSSYLIGQNTVAIPASNAVFGDPCDGTGKRLCVEASYGPSFAGSKTFSCADIGVHNVLFKVTDANGNSSTTTATITVKNATVITQDITVELDANGNASITAAQIDNGSFDACGTATLELDTTSFTCANVGPNTVTLTVTDANGNPSTATATVTVQDTTAPTVLTQDITVQLDATGNASITADQINDGSSDTCGIDSVTVSPTNFDCTNVGPNTVTLTVTDVNGNESTATATVTVQDLTAPTVVTQDIIVQLDASGNASIIASQIDNGSSDTCGIATLELDTTSFTCEDTGDNIVTLTVTDVNGNESTASAIVTVNSATVVTQDITVQLDANGNASITAAQIDNGSFYACGTTTLELDTTSFTCANVGPNTVTLTVTDGNGNPSTATATVTVQDTTAPTVLTQDITVQLDASGNASITVAQIDNGSSDTCGIASVTINTDTFSCEDIGDNIVILTVTDVNGNQSTATAIVTINSLSVNTITRNLDTLIADETGATTYQWMTYNGGIYTNILNENNQSLSAKTAGSYAVDITKNGCTQRSAVFDMTTLGNPSFDFNSKLSVYPNPFNDVISITIDTNAKVEIYTLLGETIYAKKINSGTSQLNLGNHASGMYLIKATNENNQSKIVKIVKK
jgi:hypothetical protein